MSYRVMIADDEPIMRNALLTLTDWAALDCQVVYSAANGQDVLEHIEESKADILVTDIKMPGSDGIEIAKYIWKKKLPIKVIVLTAYADFSYAQSAVKYGVSDYITKTGMFDGLIEAIENAKSSIEEERRKHAVKDYQPYIENTLKAVFDGSLYEEDEIRQRLKGLGIELTDYYLIMIKYDYVGDRQERKGRDVYKSLINFLHMVFSAQRTQAVPVERDCFVVLLEGTGDGFKEQIRERCTQIVDMMENFMRYSICIAVSGHHTEITEVRQTYEEIAAVLKEHAEDDNKIMFSDEEKRSSEGRQNLVRKCLDYIDSNYKSCILVSEIANEIGTSSSYLSRIFKEATGQTIIATLNEKKLEAAVSYLNDSDMKVYEIAEKLGFENITYFSHFFKKYMGVSPRDYKRGLE